MLFLAIARHDFESQIRSNTIENLSYNLYSYIFLKVTYKCFGSTRSQVRILSPRPFKNQVILESFPNSLFYYLHSHMRNGLERALVFSKISKKCLKITFKNTGFLPPFFQEFLIFFSCFFLISS